MRIAGLLFLMTVLPAQAQDWPNWRGPHFDGSTEAKGLPIRFSPKQGVLWSVELPGPSASTPIISKDCVFVSSTDLKAQNLCAMCFDRKTGKLHWAQHVSSGYQAGGAGNKLQLDERSNYASPSPVTDGKRVVFFYGNGDLLAFDFAGHKLWSRNIQKDYGDFAFQWTFSSSPQFYDGKLYLQVLQRNQPASGGRGKQGAESFLLCMDPANGHDIWRHVRPSDAKMESREAYSTVMPCGKQLVIAGGDVVTGHDPASGKELWRWSTYNPDHREIWWRLVPSPVGGNGVVLVCAPKRAPVYAARPGSAPKAELAWMSEERSAISSDVPTPLFYRGRFYVLSDVRKALTCVDPATGKPVWSTPIAGEMCWASPTGAEGKIYILNLDGKVIVVDASNGKVLAENPMTDGESDMRSTIAVAHNNLFIRTNTHLYCVGSTNP